MREPFSRSLPASVKGGLVVVAVLLVLGAFYFVIRPAPPPVQSPPPVARPDTETKGEIPDVTTDFKDTTEEVVFEVREMLLDLARQIRDGATGGAMYHLSGDFSGSALLGKPGDPGRNLGGVTICRNETGSTSGSRGEFRDWLSGLSVERAAFVLPRAELHGETLRCSLKFTTTSRRGNRITRREGHGKAEFVRQDGRWRLRSFARKSTCSQEGKVRFFDVTDRLELSLPPGNDLRIASRLLFGHMFLGGIAAGDFDGDGDPDLYVPRVGPNALLRNDGGRFVECGGERGVADPDAGAAALFLDVDNDGDLDLFLTNFEPPQLRDSVTGEHRDNSESRAVVLYRNDGETFTDITGAAGIDANGPAMMACAADVDGDGDLDVYVCMYHDDQVAHPSVSEEIPADVFNARDGIANQLWINQGDGRFIEEARKRGVADIGWSLAASFADYDDDGDADLYVANDYGGNRLYRNGGDGTFEDATAAASAADTGFGMGVTWFDPDLDGDLDLYVSNMYSTAGSRILARSSGKLSDAQLERIRKLARGNTFLENQGDGTFGDKTAEAGVARAGWAWSSAQYDYDNNGSPDLYVVNGFRTSGFATSDL